MDDITFRLRDYLMAYIFEIDGEDIGGLDIFPHTILVKHCTSIWTTATNLQLGDDM